MTASAPALPCYHPLSCIACRNLGAACGSHVAGTPGAHLRCTGQPAAGFQAGAL